MHCFIGKSSSTNDCGGFFDSRHQLRATKSFGWIICENKTAVIHFRRERDDLCVIRSVCNVDDRMNLTLFVLCLFCCFSTTRICSRHTRTHVLNSVVWVICRRWPFDAYTTRTTSSFGDSIWEHGKLIDGIWFGVRRNKLNLHFVMIYNMCCCLMSMESMWLMMCAARKTAAKSTMSKDE